MAENINDKKQMTKTTMTSKQNDKNKNDKNQNDKQHKCQKIKMTKNKNDKNKNDWGQEGAKCGCVLDEAREMLQCQSDSRCGGCRLVPCAASLAPNCAPYQLQEKKWFQGGA